MNKRAVKIGYLALILTIYKSKPVETAIDLIAGEMSLSRSHSKLDAKDLSDMVRLKESGLTYREIGEIYGLKPDATYNRIRKARASEGVRRRP